MSIENIFRKLMGEEAWKEHVSKEENFQKDVAKHEAMTDEGLEKSAEYYLSQCQPPKWPRGTPVYDGRDSSLQC